MEIKNPFRKRVRCCFCDRTKGFFHSVHGYGIYETDLGSRLYYHPNCLNNAICNPESVGSIHIDQALNIMELKAKNLLYNDSITVEYKEKIKKLKSICEALNVESKS